MPSNVKDLFKSKYFLIACVAVIASIMYWSLFSLNAYNTYHEYSDLGLFSYDMFYHINFASAVSGFQYLVFANHIAPDQLFVLPMFALFPSALTLLFVQVILVSITGIVIFLISLDIIKDEKISLLLCLAFLINPGTFGMLVFDYHAEIMVPLTLVLTFYFLFKRKKYPFIAALLLLLGTMEVAPFIAIAFAVTMAIYAVLRAEDHAAREDWLNYSAIAIIISVVVLIFYSFITSSLTSAYAAGSYNGMPTSLEVMKTLSQQLGSIGKGTGAPSIYTSYSISAYLTIMYLAFAFLIIFTSFGIAGIMDPLFAVLFASPWLFEVFIIGSSSFIFPWYQYFGYTLGGSAIIAMLVLRNIKSGNKSQRFSLLRRIPNPMKYALISMPVMIAFLLLIWPYFIYSINLSNFQQSFLFSISPYTQQQVQQLNSVISLIPANASVMAPDFAMPHLVDRRYLEQIPSSPDGTTLISANSSISEAMAANISKYGIGQTMWFRPEYILADFNKGISMSALNGYRIQDFENITGAVNTSKGAVFEGNYKVYYYNGSALLMKEASIH